MHQQSGAKSKQHNGATWACHSHEDLNEAQRRWVETVTTSSPAEIEPWQRKDGCKGGYLAKHPSHADQFVSHVEKRRVMRNGKRVLADVKVWEPTPDATHGGWVITRYAPPGLDLPHVYPELRPDAGIRVKVTQHTHRLDWPRDKGEPMCEAQTKHIDRHRQRTITTA